MIEIKTFAPVVIPTLCRYEHFKRCVESLARCTHADKTDLIIAFDYPVKEEHWDGYNQIKKYLLNVTGFNKVEIIARKVNYGIPKNSWDVREYVFSKYDRLILSEDDNEFSPNFLDYINKGLEKFQYDENVFAICGYVPDLDIDELKPNYCCAKSFTGWGYGILRNQYEKYFETFTNLQTIKTMSKDTKAIYDLWRHVPVRISTILEMLKQNEVKADWSINLHLYFNKMYCIKPRLSLVRNHGNDGSGINCGDDACVQNKLQNQKIDIDETFDFVGQPTIKDIEAFEKEYWKYNSFCNPFIYKIWIIFKYLFYRFTGVFL